MNTDIALYQFGVVKRFQYYQRIIGCSLPNETETNLILIQTSPLKPGNRCIKQHQLVTLLSIVIIFHCNIASQLIQIEEY